VLSVKQRIHLTDLSASFNTGNPDSVGMVAGFTQRMADAGLAHPEQTAMKMMSGMLNRKALVMAFGDAFLWLAAGTVIAALLALLAKSPKNPAIPPSGGGDH